MAIRILIISIYQSQCFVDSVRSALTKANFPADIFTGHSFCIGAATTAASAGICDSSIQSLGHWKSNAYLLYVYQN